MFAHLTQVMNAVEKAAGRVYKSEPSKPKSRTESVRSIFALHPTIPKAVDRQGAPQPQALSRGERKG